MTIRIEGAPATGAVENTLDDLYECASAICVYEVPAGTRLPYAGVPNNYFAFDGFSGDCPDPNRCALTVNADSEVIATFSNPYNYAFVTSAQFAPGDLGDTSGADDECQSAADAAGLPGTYMAWLASSSQLPHDVLNGTGAAGWLRPDGQPVAEQLGDLVRHELLYPMVIDELGANQGQASVLTGMSDELKAVGETCSDWTQTSADLTATGRASAGGAAWSSGFTSSCVADARLYCFGTNSSAPLTFVPVAGRRAFISSATITSLGAGIAAADSLCNQEATTHSQPAGSYKALMAIGSISPASAASRFTTDTGETWVRADGVPL